MAENLLRGQDVVVALLSWPTSDCVGGRVAASLNRTSTLSQYGYEQEEDVSDEGTRMKRPGSGRWTLGDLGS